MSVQRLRLLFAAARVPVDCCVPVNGRGSLYGTRRCVRCEVEALAVVLP